MTMKVETLPMPEFMILHNAIMRYPEGSALSALDPRVQVLIEAGFIRQKGALYYPTEAGVHHAMPRKRRAAH